MKSQWIFHKLTTYLPSSFSTLKIRTSPQNSIVCLNHLGLSLLLSICGKERLFKLGSSLHATFIKNPECNDFINGDFTQNVLVIWNSLLSMYAKCRELSSAVKVFDEMSVKDTVSWNVMISGFLTEKDFETGFGLFKTMQMVGYPCNFDKATLTTLFSGCDGAKHLSVTKMLHGVVLCSGYESEVTVGNALITSYFKCEDLGSGYKVFDGMFERNVVTWTAVISGLVQNEFFEDGLKLFVRMHRGIVQPNDLTYLSAITACSGLQVMKEGQQLHGIVLKLGINSDMCVESALMDLYSKSGSVEDAWKIFESAEFVDEVCVTVILVGFAQNGFEEEAFRMFVKMLKAGIEIDANVVSAVLGVFSLGTSLGLGKQIHSLIVKRGFSFNTFVSNGLINMYSKCGDLDDSIKIFDQTPNINSITWNTIIAAFARHGDAHRAIEFFHKMRLDGFRPTDVTFLSLLHASSHVGFVEQGLELLDIMQRHYGISPRTVHYACAVDMFGRAGHLVEAKSFIERLPIKPDILVWQALLGACGIHGDSTLGEHAAKQLFSAAPDSHAPYISLANIFSSEGKWKDRARTIKRMKEAGVVKETGISWIEIEKNVHSFVVEDRMHPQSEIIYGVLKELFGHLIDEGYVPDKRFILYYVNQDEE